MTYQRLCRSNGKRKVLGEIRVHNGDRVIGEANIQVTRLNPDANGATYHTRHMVL